MIERAVLLNRRSDSTKCKYLVALVKLLTLIVRDYELHLG